MKKLFDHPAYIWIIFLAGDALIGYYGYQGFVKLGFSNPLLIEILVLIGLNLLLLAIRAFYPKFWKLLTTEDVK